MSFDVNWNINKHREEHESDDHWQLRKTFMERWKNNYPEERLVCLARVFANIEFMGCRYPQEVMQEVSKLSQEVAKLYRNEKKTKLQRTFVSASDAAEDRAKGIKREGGVIKDGPRAKNTQINFVKQGESVTETVEIDSDQDQQPDTHNQKQDQQPDTHNQKQVETQEDKVNSDVTIDLLEQYQQEMFALKCIDLRRFREDMFDTGFGQLVLLIRPWVRKLSNIQASCQACHVPIQSVFEGNSLNVIINGTLLAHAQGDTKQDARNKVEVIAWDILKDKVISVLVKDKWIAQNNSRVNVSDVTGRHKQQDEDVFGTPVETSIATKMMQMMGWKGGGLGADAQGIAEPIKPHLQMVQRAGLGSSTSDIRQLKRAAESLMRRYISSDTFDVDLVFSSDFSKEERSELHMVSKRVGLASRSYGTGNDRFLVVKKKLDPFAIVKAVLEKGGETPKYKVFIPVGLSRTNGR